MILDALEVSIVLLAIPVIAADLDSSLWTAQWLMSGFAVGFAAGLLPGPALAARWGRRTTYLGATALFVLASLAGGLTSSIAVLIASRALKGFSAALTAPAGLAVITTAFPEGAPQRKAVAIYSLFGATGFTIGLLLSGVLVEVGWSWVFLFPAPIALALLIAAWLTLPRDAPQPPKITLSLLLKGNLTRSAIGAATLHGAYVSVLVLITLHLYHEFAWRPWQIAVALLPACLPLLISVPFAGQLVARFGATRLIAAGATAALCGELLYLTQPAPDSYLTGPLPVLLLVEAGFVLSFAALNMKATSTVAPNFRPAAVALYQTAVQIGGIVLLPLVTALLDDQQDPRAPLIFVTAAGLVGITAAVTGLRAKVHS
ncbi:MFS transporter [Kibdelosporangium aridum]|uniref:MFS transporter n=2 Tax=Kibdelosporangium aridum TaxID=2030 RepID=A0A428ZCL3_KIBAR|nr:MFS transporter [Kibdelosporangium aridum]